MSETRLRPRAIGHALRTMVDGVREDHRMLCHYDAKYAPERTTSREARFTRDVTTRIGFQVLVAYRLMRLCVDARVPLAPQVASRLIRHAYGSDIHWEAQLEPGVVLVHGMGLAISRAARVARGAILLSERHRSGMSTDSSGRAGAPSVEPDVHIGPGSTIVGPITLQARTKVTANCFVRTSVPPDSLDDAPQPDVSARAGRGRRAQ